MPLSPSALSAAQGYWQAAILLRQLKVTDNAMPSSKPTPASLANIEVPHDIFADRCVRLSPHRVLAQRISATRRVDFSGSIVAQRMAEIGAKVSPA
jgi:hypothetical protein